MRADAANAEQAAAWDGDEGAHWTEHWERYDAAIHRHHLRLLDGAQIAGDDHVLDIGCGCGESTRDAARAAVEGGALGVDLSARMVERARQLAAVEGLSNVWFQQVDAQVHPFDGGVFDLAISRFGAMFFGDPVAAFANIARALRSGGRLAVLSWRELADNQWLVAIREALAVGRTLPAPPVGTPGPFGLADPEAVERILTQAGFEAIGFEEVNERFYAGADGDDAFGFLGGIGAVRGMLNGLDGTSTARALDALRATMAAHETDEGVLFDSSAWLITAHRP